MVTGAMAAPCVVGVDLGGTKLLAGALDENLNVHHRAHRDMRGLDQDGAAGRRRRGGRGGARRVAESSVDAVGFGIPCLIDQTRGMAVHGGQPPLADVPFRDIMAERLGLPVVRRQRRQRGRAGRAPLRRGPRARATSVTADPRHGDRRRARARRPALPRRRSGAGAELGPHGRRRWTARAARATARTAAASRRWPRARRSRARPRRRPRSSPTRSSAARSPPGARSPARWSPSSRTAATRSAREVLAPDRPAARRRASPTS